MLDSSGKRLGWGKVMFGFDPCSCGKENITYRREENKKKTLNGMFLRFETLLTKFSLLVVILGLHSFCASAL